MHQQNQSIASLQRYISPQSRREDLFLLPSWRCHTATFDPKPTESKLRKLILDEVDVARNFQTLPAPRHAVDDTWVKVLANDKTLIVGVAMFDSIPWLTKQVTSRLAENLEILFDPRNDGIGYAQFCFGTPPKYATEGEPHRDPDPSGDVQVFAHSPYPEAHSSAFSVMRLRKHTWDEELMTSYYISGNRIRWLFAHFETNEVFAQGGKACGFNVCRNRPALDEFSSWNYCAGNGAQDPQSFGRLYRFEAPTELRNCSASREGSEIRVEGSVSRAISSLRFEIADSSDARSSVDAELLNENRWRLTLNNLDARGRLRLYPQADGATIEPRYLAIDLPEADRASNFVISVTFDTPDDLHTVPYTPQRMDAEMKAWRSLGVGRVNIIDYTNWPSFWKYPLWRKMHEPSLRACGGDMLKCFARAAHDHGLELISDLKTFDLGANWFPVPNDRRSTALEVDNRYSSVVPEIAAHREWTMKAHPELKREAAFPIRRLRLYSLEAIPALRRGDVEILTSRDNRKYTAHRKPYKIAVKQINRPHKRWTPTGAVADSGSTRNWVIEIDGLDLREPFVALRFKRNGVALVQRGYMVAEAFADGDGNPQPFTVATNGNTKEGFFCWRGWQGWTNLTENLLTVRRWPGPEFGLVFRIDEHMPSLLEPAYEGARNIWLNRVKYLLDAGADGVSIRTYCHHAGPMCYLQYAYATPILEAFKQQFGRMPESTPCDYQAIREIRRDAYTQFMRDARAVTHDRGKKLMFELESGQELSAENDCRMQLPIDWERWIREGLVDEVRLKWWTPQTPFVHERVLPLARKHGVPVSVISRCLHTGVGTRTTEMAAHVIAGAAAAGFDGYNLYEHQNLMDMSPERRVVFKGPVDAYVGAAREALAQIASKRSD